MFRIKGLSVLLVLTCSVMSIAHAQAPRDHIYIVGSSTVFPFAAVVAEAFGRRTPYKTPKIEPTGSGGGLKLFCDGVGVEHPDIANASRRIKASEMAACKRHGVQGIIEVKIGYDGIVLANARRAPRYELTRRQIYLALAKQVPAPDGGERLVENPYSRWSEISPELPDKPIEVLGPPPTSGTRDAFVELAMEGGCTTFDWIRALADSDKGRFQTVCQSIREDGHFIEAGENDNLIVQKLERNPDAIGVFGFSFLDQNYDLVQGSVVDGAEPSFEAIAAGDYPISRSLYFYVKKQHIDVIPGIREYLAEFTSDAAWGPDGYLADRGLIPLPDEERDRVASRVRDLHPLQLAAE